MPIHNVPHLSPQAIYLSSVDGIHLNPYGNHVQFPLRNTIQIPSNCQGYVSLSSFRYSNVFYTVDPFHCVLYYSLSNEIGTTLEYEIPHGNYSVNSLLEQLNTDLADHAFVFAYNPKTFKISVTNDVFGFIFREGARSFYREIGFRVPTVQDVSYTAHSCIQLGGVPAITIAVPSLHIDSNGSFGQETSVLDRVANSVMTGQTMTYADTAGNKYRVYENSISTIEIHLTNQGTELDFLGSAWYITLHINFIYTPLYIAPYNEFPRGEGKPLVSQASQMTPSVQSKEEIV